MEVVLLGTGSPLPDANRAGPATLVRAAGQHLLFDCGRGVLMRLAGAGVMIPFLNRLFLTHLHSDHITDFNDVVTMRWTMSPVDNPLPITGPPGTEAFVQRTVDMLTTDIGYRRAHHDDLQWDPSFAVDEVLDGVAYEAEGLHVIAAPTDHRPVKPTVGYRIEADGKAVVIAGDTVPCEGLDRLCTGADVYVQTVIRNDLVRTIPSPRLQDIHDYHSSVEDAGRTAAKAGVDTLVLTHQIPTPLPGSDAEWIGMAAAFFDGDIHFGADLDVITA